MVLRSGPAPLALAAAAALIVGAALAPAGAGAQAEPPAPRPGEITLAVKDYLDLSESARRQEKARQLEQAKREAPAAEVVAQRLRVAVDGTQARLTTEIEVLVQGAPGVVALPLSGIAERIEVQPAGRAAVGLDGAGHATLVAPAAGRFTVRIDGSDRLASGGGVGSLLLAPIAAAVAEIDLDLPADLAWSCSGTVLAGETVLGGRRRLRLSARRGGQPSLELRRHLAGDQSAELLAETAVLTLLHLAPDGPRRHDVVLFEVSRGALADLTVDLPAGLQVERAATDEGPAVPVVEARRLTVHRRRQLQGTGFLVLTSTPALRESMALELVRPRLEPRARYFAAAATLPAELLPQPAAAWVRIDLDDLPAALRDALAALDLTAAWRLTGTPGAMSVRYSALPPAASLETVVRRRETTTLLSVDGTLLYRDRFLVDPAGVALTLELPAGATLWTVKVGEQPVRPVVDGATIAVPLGAAAAAAMAAGAAPGAPAGAAAPAGPPVVEVIAVLARALPAGRSRLPIELPRVHAPVLEQSWSLLLPVGPRFRLSGGDLRPVRSSEAARGAVMKQLAATPGVTAARLNTGGNEGASETAPSPLAPGSGALWVKAHDQTGAVLPGVTLTLIGEGQRVRVTDAQGEAGFVGIAAGRYLLRAELQGFSPSEVPRLEVNETHTTRIEVTLSSAVEDVITVTASAGGEARPEAYDISAWRLRRGLVGGVKPLAIDIPEVGKVLLLTGVLPPERVAVELEVRAPR